MKPALRTLMLVALALVLAGASQDSGAAARAHVVAASQDPLVQDRDLHVRPGDDFFEYANGAWLKAHPIPAAERGWGIGRVVQDDIYGQLRDICRHAAESEAGRGSIDQKVGDYWATGLDSVRVEHAGKAPIQPYLDRIDAIRTRADLLQVVAQLHALGFDPVYGFYIGQDERRSDRYAIHLTQGGIHLPDRDYFFDTDPQTKKVRSAYPGHLTAMFKLLGDTTPRASRGTAAVMRLETALARASRKIEQLRDPWANYHKLSIRQLDALTPGIEWRRHLGYMDLRGVDTVIVGQPEFLQAADSLLRVAPLPDWKSYLRWTVATSLASHLSHSFDVENFRFYGTILSGTRVQRPRWKRVLDAEEGEIGELMGRIWVERYCSPATKARYQKLANDIISVYRDRMRELPWMSDATKRRAIAKLDKVARKVAYPEHWRDFSTLHLDRTSYAANEVRINTWWFRHEAGKLGKPIDRTEWDMTPQTYNAYYDGTKVEIVLPCAVFMLPGVPDSLMDDALLYSYVGGSTIGHEITHGFDDEGRQFDEHGNLNPWWTAQDSVEFQKRAERLARQFDAYVVDGKHVRGHATLGENIADLGGIRLGYEAFKKTDEWKRGEKVNGLTPDQRYFLGYALSWMERRRPEVVQQLIMSDVHAPDFLRVNGPLSNLPEFYAAFGVKPGDKLWRPDTARVVVW